MRLKKGSIKPDWVRTLAKTGTSLGTVLGPANRTLLFHLLTRVQNGDRIVLKKLDTAVSVTAALDEDDHPRIWIDLATLTDQQVNTDNILKDILDVPRARSSQASYIFLPFLILCFVLLCFLCELTYIKIEFPNNFFQTCAIASLLHF